MDCEGCELKVKKALYCMKGVQEVVINQKQQQVSVTRYVELYKVLKKARSTGKKVEFWPYVPYKLQHGHLPPTLHRHMTGRHPPGYVRNVEYVAASRQAPRQVDQLTNMFSDENPNACSIM